MGHTVYQVVLDDHTEAGWSSAYMGHSLSCTGGFIRQIAVQSWPLWLQLCGSPHPRLSPVFVAHDLTDDGSRCQSEAETAVLQAPGEDIYIFY